MYTFFLGLVKSRYVWYGLVFGVALAVPQIAQAQDTYVVNSTDDIAEAEPDGTCSVFVGEFPVCTLREAIREANADADRDSISFEDIPTTNGFATISLGSNLGTLEVREEVVINGRTAPGYPSASANGPIVKIDGSNISGDVLGMGLGADGSRIAGFAIVNGAGEGIEVSPDGSVSDISILSCFVGIDVDGTTVQGNLRSPDESGDAAGISIVDTNGSRISGNLVSGNLGDGILIRGDSNLVTNNIVGLDHNGDAPKGNAGHGVHVAPFSSGNRIGDAFSFDTFSISNGNTIAANDGAGVLIEGDGNGVSANLIGTDGSSAFPNSTGIVIEGSSSQNPAENNRIGSGDDIDQNTISGNQFNGIRLGNGAENLSANSNIINNNKIGTDSSGTRAISNGNGGVEGGIRIDDGTDNEMINNVISGNNAHGIRIRGPSPNNIIRGNRIGVDVNGSPLGNDFRGIWIQTDNNVIGGASSGDENTVGSNSSSGIVIEGSSNLVADNLVGVTRSGEDIGNEARGIAVFGSDRNEIFGNTVGNNNSEGVLLRNASENRIRANRIGTGPDEAAAPNGAEGVLVLAQSDNSSNDNVVTGAEDGGPNTVANNQGDGVRIGGSGTTLRNAVRRNRIRGNTGLGINLGSDGVTVNDDGDGDDGPNRLQNFPELQGARYNQDTGEVTVTYLVPSSPDRGENPVYPLTVDFYAADTEDEEGRAYIGTDTYTSVEPGDYGGCGSPPCTVTTTFTPQASVSEGDALVATATDGAGNTSEFSPSLTITDPILEVRWPRPDPEQGATLDAGTTLDVEVSVSESFVPTEAQLFYRRGGETDYRTEPLEESETGALLGTIPGEAATLRGIEFFVRLSSESITTTFPENTPAEQPVFVPVRRTTLDAGVTLAPETYRMISVPAELDTADALAQLRDDFGDVNRATWRLLRWENAEGPSVCGAGEYREATLRSGAGAAGLEPGRAYWLITRTDGTFDVENARSVETDSLTLDPFTLTLPPGLSQIANPFPYPVLWEEVEGREVLGSGSPASYDPGAQGTDPYSYNEAVLDPWKGYWVCNPVAEPVEIAIPPREAPSEPLAAARTEASTREAPEALFGTEPAYALQLTATLRQAGEAVSRDAQNVVGVARGSNPGVGREDVVEPPPIRDRLRLSIVEDSTRLAGSLRPKGQEGHTWNLDVSAPAAKDESAQRTLKIHLRSHGNRPSDFVRQLLDRETGRRIPIEDKTATLPFPAEQSTRHLRLVLGSDAFARAESEETSPNRTGLRAVYPNPSLGRVFVDYQLKTARHIQISVYDVLGRRVETLVDTRRPAGHHTVYWDGRSGSDPVASGAYFVRMKTESVVSSQRVSIVR